MEQNDTNNTSQNVAPAKEMLIYDKKPGLQIVIIVGIIALIFLYVTVWVPRQECAKKTEYEPASSGTSRWSGSEGYYTYTGSGSRKFKTREEAISSCVSDK